MKKIHLVADIGDLTTAVAEAMEIKSATGSSSRGWAATKPC